MEEFIFTVLMILMVLHSLFGRNLPKWVWYLSLVSSIVFGLYFGITSANYEYPDGLILGIMCAIPLFLLTLLIRWTRKDHEY